MHRSSTGTRSRVLDEYGTHRTSCTGYARAGGRAAAGRVDRARRARSSGGRRGASGVTLASCDQVSASGWQTGISSRTCPHPRSSTMERSLSDPQSDDGKKKITWATIFAKVHDLRADASKLPKSTAATKPGSFGLSSIRHASISPLSAVVANAPTIRCRRLLCALVLHIRLTLRCTGAKC
eukprot:SAG31_NODE_2148_length_6333_cov_16.166667_2_plen_181_part_00